MRCFAGLRDSIGLHSLCHTFCSRMVMAGIDLVTVQELLGHSSLDMVMRYSHMSPAHRRKAVEALETPVSRLGVHIGVHPGGKTVKTSEGE